MKTRTFEELNLHLGGREKRRDWRRHKNGGGWIHRDSKVSPEAFVGPLAIVYGTVGGLARIMDEARVMGSACVMGVACVCDKAYVGGHAKVTGSSFVMDNARVTGNARICSNARVGGESYVDGDTRIGGFATVGGAAHVVGKSHITGHAYVCCNARIVGGKWSTSPLFIVGSRHSITNSKPGHVTIGCLTKPFKWWLSKEAIAVAKLNGYTKEQIREYREYIKVFIKNGK